MTHFPGRLACAAALLALLAVPAAAGASQAAGPPSVSATAAPTGGPNPGVRNYLTGVEALTSTDVWAVGYYCTSGCGTPKETDQTLIERWDGTAWTQIPSPDPSTQVSRLRSVTATSASDAWAVGYYCSSNCNESKEQEQTLILHWNGTAWSQVTSPNTFSDELESVTATSPTDAWAVGYYCESGCLNVLKADGTLIEHWNGTDWSKVTSPSPGAKPLADGLRGTAATGTADAWAGGTYCASGCGTPSEKDKNLIEHWTGTAWSQIASPTPKGGPVLYTVSADSSTDAWAAGYDNGSKTMLLHWNGTAWSKATSPDPGSVSLLYGLAAESPTDAWAVGKFFSASAGGWKTLILHWDGTAWQRVSSPSPGPKPHPDGLVVSQVSADSAADAWAVGSYCSARCATNSERDHTLILHWNGTRWSVS
jgi:hypothetical protein